MPEEDIDDGWTIWGTLSPRPIQQNCSFDEMKALVDADEDMLYGMCDDGKEYNV